VITFHPTNSKLLGYIVYRDYINYIAFSYIIYILFSLYMVSARACPVTLTSVKSDSIWPRPALKTLETAQLRPQDVSKHVPTCADIFISWLGRLTIFKSAVPDRLEPGIQRGGGLRKKSSLRKIFLWGSIMQNRYYWFSTGTIQVRYNCIRQVNMTLGAAIL
jgi:hypothetical protein